MTAPEPRSGTRMQPTAQAVGSIAGWNKPRQGRKKRMTTAIAEPTKAAPSKGVVVTDKALAKVRTAMAKEGVSPEQGGLRLGVQGGGCSGLSYNIRFDTQPRERDRIFQFSDVR